MKSIFLVASGGALGSVVRYLISIWLHQNYTSAFPWNTLFVNISGCIAIGILYGISQGNPSYELMRLLLMVGFLGGYTTFSSFGLETITMIQNGSWFHSCAYVVLSNIFCLAGVYLGFILTTRVFS